MLSEHVNAAMRQAHYEILENGEGFYGEIPVHQGVFANAATLAACRVQLQEVLEEWILLRVSRNLDVPAADGRKVCLRELP